MRLLCESSCAMEGTRDTALRIDSVGPQRALPIATFRAVNGWWLFCVVVFAMKLLLLWLDPRPKLFIGDSGASGLSTGSAAVATCSRSGALRTADWLQDELPPGSSSLHDSTAVDCVCPLWSSVITQADIENRRSNWVNTCDGLCYDDVDKCMAPTNTRM